MVLPRVSLVVSLLFLTERKNMGTVKRIVTWYKKRLQTCIADRIEGERPQRERDLAYAPIAFAREANPSWRDEFDGNDPSKVGSRAWWVQHEGK
jgi:hypothetical protein